MQVADSAHSDFLRVRRKAFWRGITKWLLRSDDALLAFEDVLEHLRAYLQHDGGLREVEIDQIVGSVGRYRDFDRAFLAEPANPARADEYGDNVRRKLEPKPSTPRYFITEPGMGYRFEPSTV